MCANNVGRTLSFNSLVTASGEPLLEFTTQKIARNFGRSLRIPDASLQTSVNFPRTRPLKCMEQTAFLFNLNQERTEMKIRSRLQ